MCVGGGGGGVRESYTAQSIIKACGYGRHFLVAQIKHTLSAVT